MSRIHFNPGLAMDRRESAPIGQARDASGIRPLVIPWEPDPRRGFPNADVNRLGRSLGLATDQETKASGASNWRPLVYLDARKETSALEDWKTRQFIQLNANLTSRADMKPIAFKRLERECPEFNHVWQPLREWFLRHRDDGYVATSRLAGELRSINPLDLVLAMREMIDRKMAASGFQAARSDGEVVSPVYDRPTDIPASLLRRPMGSGEDARGAEIIVGYRWGLVSGD